MPAKNPKTSSYPETLQEAILYYADPDNTLAAAIKFRWPEGVTCPRCGGTEHSFLTTRRIWKCKNRECKKQFSAKVGTIFEDSPLGLDKWFVVLWMIVNAKNGISSWEVHRAIGVTQKTAWFMLHRLRLVLQGGTPDEPLTGTVEADETFIGGKAKNMHAKQRKLIIQGRGAVGKAIVLGLLERHKPAKGEKKASRVRLKIVSNRQQETVQPEVRATIAPGSNLYTDAAPAYVGMEEYIHEAVDHAEAYVRGAVHTNGLENFWSLLKRCIGGTYVWVEAEHLGAYLDEQAYRFNERKRNDQERFFLAGPAISGRRLTYKELIARPEGTPPRRGG